MSAAGVTSRRSTSRSRRSHASFSDLRLAPLSSPSQSFEKADKSASSQGDSHGPKMSWEGPDTPGGTAVDPDIAHAYKINHPSYLAGRSAPTTPGILSRSGSRKASNSFGMSKNTVFGDEDNAENVEPGYFTYAAAPVISQGGVDRDSAYIGDKGKSKSESGLLNAASVAKRKQLRPLSTAVNNLSPSITYTSTPRGRTSKRSARGDPDSDWLSHATNFTTSLLQEGKAGSWASTNSSITNLHTYAGHARSASFSSTDDDDNNNNNRLTSPPTATRERFSAGTLELPSAISATSTTTVTPLRSPALGQHGWSSRFGSRHASAQNSRRNSRVHLPVSRGIALTTTNAATNQPNSLASSVDPTILGPDFIDANVQREADAGFERAVNRGNNLNTTTSGYFDPQPASSSDDAPSSSSPYPTGTAGRDEDDEDDEDDEREVERLARTPGFGLGGFGILDRLIGLGGFGEGTVTDDDDDDDGGQTGARQVVGAGGAGKRRPVAGEDARAGGGEQQQQEGQGQGRRKEDTAGGGKDEGGKGGEDGEGGWRDAAWLLSVASKALLS